MFTNIINPTRYYPFDYLAPVVSIPIKDSNGTAIQNAWLMYLNPNEASELCYNTKALLFKTPTFDIWSEDLSTLETITPSYNFIINRYKVGSNVADVRFAIGTLISTGQEGLGTYIQFFIDFSLGRNVIGPNLGGSYVYTNKVLFAIIYQCGIIQTISGENGTAYIVPATYMPTADDTEDQPATVDFRGFDSQPYPFQENSMSLQLSSDIVSYNEGLGGRLSIPNGNISQCLGDGLIVATEKIDQIYFSPNIISSNVANQITITCPATKYAVANSFDKSDSRLGFKYLTELWFEGLAGPIVISNANKLTNILSVQDTVKVTIPANSGITTGKIGMYFSYPQPGSVSAGTGVDDYFETIQELKVV